MPNGTFSLGREQRLAQLPRAVAAKGLQHSICGNAHRDLQWLQTTLTLIHEEGRGDGQVVVERDPPPQRYRGENVPRAVIESCPPWPKSDEFGPSKRNQ